MLPTHNMPENGKTKQYCKDHTYQDMHQVYWPNKVSTTVAVKTDQCRQTDRQTIRQTGRPKGRQTDRMRDRLTERQSDREKDKLTHTHTLTHTPHT